MPAQSNDSDKLEQFFRKAATRADITFNEEDWKKLEARLDAVDAGSAAMKKAGSKIAAAVIIGIGLLVSTAVWVNSRYEVISFADNGTAASEVTGVTPPVTGELHSENDKPARESNGSGTEDVTHEPSGVAGSGLSRNRSAETEEDLTVFSPKEEFSVDGQDARVPSDRTVSATDEDRNPKAESEDPAGAENEVRTVADDFANDGLPAEVSHETIERDLIRTSAALAQRNKQKAVVELPGAEEEKTIEAEAMVEEEHASNQKKHVATPRLSLLLSFAPDFSGTSMGQYSAPGKAFGVVIHYHLLNRWSISSGVIKNYKQYTSAGEYYKPPKGYWKYYTNGVIPESIDGSCNILEFPLMIQYTAIDNGKNRLNAGAGLSSYLMQTESYRYHFQQPNPGAKEGWDSRGSSRFFFNMLNFTIGYERQVAPGLLLGIEPYAKIPLEEIGWSNLRLFSTGASVTLRYIVLRKENLSPPARSRAPD